MSEHITNEQLNTKIDGVVNDLTDHKKQHTDDNKIVQQKLDKVAGIWWKIGGIILIPFLMAIYGYGVLNDKVANLKEDIEKKASKETVEVQLASINTSLSDIKTTLQELSKKK